MRACLCIMWLNMKYCSNFLSSWSTKFFLPRTRAGWHADDVEDYKVSHFQMCLCGYYKHEHSRHAVIDNSAAVHFLSGEDAFHKKTVSLYSCLSYFCCLCLQKAGRREQKSVWTNSLYCNLFYSTFPWRKLKKRFLLFKCIL